MKLRTLAVTAALLACDSKPKVDPKAEVPPAPEVTALEVPDGEAKADAPGPKAEAQSDLKPPTTGAEPKAVTVDDAKAFIADVNDRFLTMKARAETAEYIKSTYITPDTERNAASAQSDVMAFLSEAVPKAATFRDLELPKDDRRTLELLRTSPTLPAPADRALREELAALSAKLEGHYGAAKACKPGKDGKEVCRELGELSGVLYEQKSTWDDRVAAWTEWHATAAEQRPRYERLVELGNQGAKELGFTDLGDLWRSNYDMTGQAFEAEIDRLWKQVQPLYEKLHCLVRDRLSKQWGADKVPASGPIPTQVLGNMWAQDWGALYPLVTPFPKAQSSDLTKAIAAKLGPTKTPEQADAMARGIVKIGEGFFTSLGMEALPQTFWDNSQFTKPLGRDVVCHASAWDVTWRGEVRLKMCIEGSDDDFTTVHHELGHIYYFLAYNKLPVMFQNGANDGFHEAIGDAIALSITPSYLVEMGLMAKPTGAAAKTAEEAMLNEQMKRALEKIAFLPFGRLTDQWRWDVFSGKVPKDQWNARWWELKAQIQGVAPPAARTEADFDPAAKYHVPASVPYMRYFLAAILQFQFHRALCKASGHEGPLNTCSIYGNKEAGARLQKLLAAGASLPWQEALQALTGETEMDASAILDYFAPLSAWLDTQTQGLTCGY